MKANLTLFVAILSAALFWGGCASQSFNKGLVAYYPFNGNAKDETGNGHDGEVSGAKLAVDRHGESNRAYQFPAPLGGTPSSIKMKSTKLLLTPKVTISYWIYRPLQNREINNIFSGPDYQTYILRRKAWNEISFGTDTGQYGEWHNLRVPVVFKQSWVMATFVFDGVTQKVFINGRMKAQREINIPPSFQHPDGMHIGRTGRNSHYYIGLLDDLRIYNRALSGDEVKALYDLEKPKGK